MKKVLCVGLLGLTLTACGGGSGGDSYEVKKPEEINESGVNNSKFDSITQFNWGSVQFKTGFVEIIKHARNADVLYTNYQKIEPDNINYYKRPFLSKDGLYKLDKTNYPLGYRTYKINYVSKDGNIFNKTPYNVNGLNQLKIQESGSWVSLDNTLVSERTAVYWNLLATGYPNSGWFESGTLGDQFKRFLAATKVTKFPAGAKCFKSKQTKYSQPFYVITNEVASVYVNGQTVNTFDQYLNAVRSDGISGNWGGTPWSYLKQYDGANYSAATIYANIDNKLSEGFWSKDPNLTIEKRLDVYNNLLKEPNLNSEDKVSFNAAIEEINTECTYYNDIAANVIESLIQQNISN